MIPLKKQKAIISGAELIAIGTVIMLALWIIILVDNPRSSAKCGELRRPNVSNSRDILLVLRI
jgi:hypothetical protein